MVVLRPQRHGRYAMSRRGIGFALAALLAAVVLSPAWTPTTAGAKDAVKPDPNLGIWKPDQKPYGKTYGEWVGAFWKYALEFPLEGHPFLDTPQYDFAARQSGKAWFWSAPDGGPLTRKVSMPEGTALFLTIRDAEVSSLEEGPFFGETEEEQREQVNYLVDHVVDVFVEIDGVPVKDLAAFRFSSPQVEVDAPSPFIFGEVGGKGTTVGDGYFLMLKPLSPGKHVIHYGGTFHFGPGELDPSLDFEIDLPKDVTIELTVTTGKGH